MRGDSGTSDDISIHAPRTGSDVPAAVILADIRLFQSTLPARGATSRALQRPADPCHFNPRSPHGERLCYSALIISAF